MAVRKTRKTKDAQPEISVKVGRTGGRVEEYLLEGDEPTVGDALAAAGIELSKGQRVRVGGESAEEDTIVEDGDIITVQGKVSGGNN